jgi:DNA-binding transcriptional ArsR family regulator
MSPEKEVLLRHEMALGSDADNVHAAAERMGARQPPPASRRQSGPAFVEGDDPTAAVCDLAQALGLPLACRLYVCYILNHMVQYARTPLDASFAALSDATRRGVLEQLGRADASITDLAEKFQMTLTGMRKHVGVLEQAGLVTTEKVGRVRTCNLGPRRLEEEAAWIERYRQLWDARFDELDKVVEELKRKEKVDGRKKRE